MCGMTPDQLFAALSDPTRLRSLVLIQSEGEVCVCELTFALDESANPGELRRVV